MFKAGLIPTGCISGHAASNEAAALWAVVNGPSLPDPWAIPQTLKAEARRLSEGAFGVVVMLLMARSAARQSMQSNSAL